MPLASKRDSVATQLTRPLPLPLGRVNLAEFRTCAKLAHEALPSLLALSLEPPGELPTNARYYVTPDRLSGFGVTYSGELIHLYSRGRGQGALLIASAKELGASHLHCFQGPLVGIYQRNGFHVTGASPFDIALAPKGWSVKDWGTPALVEMAVD